MEENVRLGKELHPVIADKLNVADLREPLAFETGFFDLVLCNAVLQHMNSETAESTTIPELARILAPGGVLQREQRAAGEPVVRAVRTGLQNVTIPLGLAAGTTIVSLLASLFSRIGAIGDFGIIAGLGVGMSLIVMLTLLPAARTIIDRRREARGTLTPPRLISNALPGIERIAESLGTAITRRPAPYIVVVLAVTVGLGFAATGLKSEFSIRDILPRGGTVLADLMTLDAAVGGSTEMVSVLVKAEATETRTLLNVHDLTTAFEDERLRPPGAAGPIQGSYELLVNDWTNNSGEPGDN